MSALSVSSPYPIFTDIDGQPLEAGYVWIGTANLDPQTNPINVFWDAALTIPAPQPIRTLAGYPAFNGTPARLYANSDYSIRVMNKNGSTIYSAANNDGQANLLIDDLASTAAGKGAELVGFKQAGTGAVNRTALAKMRETVSATDFGADPTGATDSTTAINSAIAAVNVSFSAVGQIGSTNVQSAIEEVSTECRNADNITSGTLVVARGGTGLVSYTKGDLIAASGTTTLAKLAVGTNGQVLRANSATTTGLEWGVDYLGTVTTVTSSTAALTIATATTTPALTIRSATTSVNGIVQLSDSISTTSSVLAATPTAVKTAYDIADAALPKAGGVITGVLEIGNAGSLVFEGSTNDGNETTLTVADPTADRTITLPNATGTVALTSDLNDGTY
jgi:hypothetical protein